MFDIDPDPARAEALPPAVYTDPALLAREQERVFAATWQLVGRAEQLADVGSYVTAELGGEPVLIVRDADRLRGWFNVCPHRAGPLARGCGKRKTIQCGYHGWTFGLDGRLLHAPESEGCDLSSIALAPIEVAVWGPLVFAAIAPAMPFDAYLGGVPAPSASLRWVMRRDFPVDANWKVYVDNYLEGYHIPVVHPELHKELDYDRYRTVTDRWWSRQFAPLRPLPPDPTKRAYRPEREDEEAEYYWAFPNLMLNIYQGMLQTNVVVPLSADRTNVVFEWYAAEPPADAATDEKWQRLVEMSVLLQDQDAAICATVQRNLRSRGARRGRYAPKRENGVHHFHRLLAELL
jgi:choline monooxygenase